MESSIIKKSSQLSKILTRTRQRKIIIVTILTLITLLASFLWKSSNSTHAGCSDHTPPPAPPLHTIIKNACINTLYPSLCSTTLSSIPAATNNATTLHHILEFTINQTMTQVSSTRSEILNSISSQDLMSHEKNAVEDCKEMLDQTLYELQQAIEDLHSFHHGSYSNLKTLLSAAMTNENTCIDGFADLEESDEKGKNGLIQDIQYLLGPILKMISNCLAMIKNMETINRGIAFRNSHNDKFLHWMTSRDRKMMETGSILIRPNVIVAKDGSGNYTMIGKAVKMAPNKSLELYVIEIKAGIYEENVVIPRGKTNIMLIGKGMNKTVITGSKNFVDGFSTFTSATLSPEKHQAVALRVTSNAAFYRCEFISYQDTLYAHSLRQFYRECRIQGTVDFIFGNAAVIFLKCLILVRKPNPDQKNMITAQGRHDPNQNTGISLQNCVIMAAPDFTSAETHKFPTFLGRPWRNYSRTVIMRSYIGDLIHKQGWSKWDRYSTLDTVEYIEYRNFGPGSDTRHRVTWAGYRKNCTEDIVRQFTVEAFLHGADDWLESTVFALFGTPKAKRMQGSKMF